MGAESESDETSVDVDTSEFEGGGDGGGGSQAESPAEASERERRELAALLDGDQADQADEGDRDAKPGKAEGKPDKKAEPKKNDDQADGDSDGKEGEGKGSLAKNWREYRRARAGLDAREQQLAQREARLKEAEGDRAKASQRLTALERLAAGDVEALDELGLDFEKLTAGYLGRQSGDKPRSREKDPTIVALEKRLDEERAARETEAAERQYREAVGRFEAAAAGHKILAKFTADERVDLGNRLAYELRQAGKKVPPPEEIAGLLAQRLRADAERMRALLDEEGDQPPPPAKGAKPAPKPISARDRAERGGTRRPAFDDDERDREREEIARELFGR